MDKEEQVVEEARDGVGGWQQAGQQPDEEQKRKLETRLRRAIRARDAYLEALKRTTTAATTTMAMPAAGQQQHQQKQQFLLQMPINSGKLWRRSRSTAPRRAAAAAAAQHSRRQQQMERLELPMQTVTKERRFASVGDGGRVPLPNFASKELRNDVNDLDAAGGTYWNGQAMGAPAEELLHKFPSLLARLENSAFFWETGREKTHGIEDNNNTSTANGPLEWLRPLNGKIPQNYNFLLESDMPAMDAQLDGIRNSLVQLREFRLSQPTREYFQFFPPPHHHHQLAAPRRPFPPSNRLGQNEGHFRDNNNNRGREEKMGRPTLAQIRSRLVNMEFHIENRIRELLAERQQKFRTWTDQSGQMTDNREEGNKVTKKRIVVMEREADVGIPDNADVHYHKQQQQQEEQSQQTGFARAGNDFAANEERQRWQETNGMQTKTTATGGPMFSPIRPIIFGNDAIGISDASNENRDQRREGGGGNEGEQKEQQKPPMMAKMLTNQMALKAQPDSGAVTTTGGDPVSGAPMSREQLDFERMMQVLKNPRRFDLSSSSSSENDDDIEKPITIAPPPPPITSQQNLANQQRRMGDQQKKVEEEENKLNEVPQQQHRPPPPPPLSTVAAFQQQPPVAMFGGAAAAAVGNVPPSSSIGYGGRVEAIHRRQQQHQGNSDDDSDLDFFK